MPWLLLILLLTACGTTRSVVHGLPGTVVGKEVNLPPPTTWAISGYLHDNPGKKVYVALREGRIVNVGVEKPRLLPGRVVETESTIFPGFVNLQGPGELGALPPWPGAKSQFHHRFEWPQLPSFRRHQELQSLLTGDDACAAERWAEIKALSGGTTVLQGGSACSEGFATANLESPAEMGGAKFLSIPRAIQPDQLSAFYRPKIEALIAKGDSYDAALDKVLTEQKVKLWVDLFVMEPHTVGNALKLLVGNDFFFAGTQFTERDYDQAEPRMRKFLAGAPYRLKGAEITRQIAHMKAWIFSGSPSFLKSPKTESAAYAFLGREGILTLPALTQNYLSQFETTVREPALAYLEGAGPHAMITTLGEGLRLDPQNSSEFKLAQIFGFVRPGLVIAQGAGLSPGDMQVVSSLNLSLVFSLYSNLQFYGETLDLANAKGLAVNLSLGSHNGWAGSKNVLEELKIFRAYANQQHLPFTNREIINLVTLNPVRALQKENEMGAVRPGYLANLTLLDCPVAQNTAECALGAGLDKVTLVVVNGFGAYGDVELIRALATSFADPAEPELLPRRTPSSVPCQFRKALRLPPPTAYDQVLASKGINLRSVEQLQYRLEAALNPIQNKLLPRVPVDPLFSCEDPAHSKRAAAFVETILPANLKARPLNRREIDKLSDPSRPLATPAAKK
jgi:hypothetical protein